MDVVVEMVLRTKVFDRKIRARNARVRDEHGRWRFEYGCGGGCFDSVYILVFQKVYTSVSESVYNHSAVCCKPSWKGNMVWSVVLAMRKFNHIFIPWLSLGCVVSHSEVEETHDLFPQGWEQSMILQ
jgi:hypothetical protein